MRTIWLSQGDLRRRLEALESDGSASDSAEAAGPAPVKKGRGRQRGARSSRISAAPRDDGAPVLGSRHSKPTETSMRRFGMGLAALVGLAAGLVSAKPSEPAIRPWIGEAFFAAPKP